MGNNSVCDTSSYQILLCFQTLSPGKVLHLLRAHMVISDPQRISVSQSQLIWDLIYFWNTPSEHCLDFKQNNTKFMWWIEKVCHIGAENFGVHLRMGQPHLSQRIWWILPYSTGVILYSFKIFIFGCTGSFVVVERLSLVAASRGYSLLAVLGVLIVVASLVAEHGL